MGPMMQTLSASLRFSDFIMNLITQEVRDEDARRRTGDGQGPSLSWVVGHLIGYRVQMMELLGKQVGDPLGGVFTDSATDGHEYPPLGELLTAWNQTAAQLAEAAAQVDDELLLASPGGDGPHGEESRLETLSFLAWHESYHIGQMGTLRRQMGYPATADLAMAASQNA